MPSEDIEYFRARAVEERQRAIAAEDPNIRTLHLEFARSYERVLHEAKDRRMLEASRNAIKSSLNLLKATST